MRFLFIILGCLQYYEFFCNVLKLNFVTSKVNYLKLKTLIAKNSKEV